MTTPDSPKGPESEARPEEETPLGPPCECSSCLRWRADREAWEALPLRERVAREISRVDGGASSIEPCGDATYEGMADAALAVVEPELERLTAEVERLQVELGTIRGELADFAQESMPSHVSTLQAVRWLIAEHDEQVKHNEEVGEENRALCNERDEWKRAAEAETQGRRVEVSRLREQLAAQQPVWAPADPTDESARLAEALRFVGVVDPDDDCMSVFDTTGEGIKHWVPVESIALRVLEYTAGVSSSEVEAPQPQEMTHHKVSVRRYNELWWQAKCPECDLLLYRKSQQEAADWKDQHEADTLRPTLATGGLVEAGTLGLRDESGPPGFVVPQRSEGRPSGSERLAPRPRLAYADRMLTECCASEGVTGIDCRLPKGHADWHSGRFDPTGEGYESGYPVCIQWPRNEWDRCEPEQVAAQAARSEATPEALADHAKVMADQHRQLADFIEAHAPSPSLRKEGGDTHG